MTKLTSASLQVATHLWDRVVNVTWERASEGTCYTFLPITLP